MTAQLQPEKFLGTGLVGFMLTDFIGEGGMAVVYRGENMVDPSIVRAIKIVRPEYSARRDFVLRFSEEARILERLSHPNIVRFYGVRKEQDNLVMELEFLRGRPLSATLEKNGSTRLPIADVVGWFVQACDGVAAAHALDVVHRDIKPENLFLTEDGQVKVLDFGIARAVDDAERATRATAAGTTPGTAAYLAPEVWGGTVPAASADVYALGLSLFELLVGFHPFGPPGETARSSPQLMFMHLQEGVPPLRRFRPEAPELLDKVVARATAKEVSERYASAKDLAAALRDVLARLPGADASSAPVGEYSTQFALPQFGGHRDALPSTSKALTVGAPSAPPRKSSAGIVVGGIVALVAVAAGAFLFLRGKHAGGESGHGASTASAAGSVSAAAAQGVEVPTLNRWVDVQLPKAVVRLGLDEERSKEPGFRPSRNITAPAVPYQIQQHEVTWEEIDPFLGKNEPKFVRPAFVPKGAERNQLPATGVPWKVALAYCRDIGGSLPTEEQWEFAARSAERRPFAWGAELLDLARTNAFAGPTGKLRAVMTSEQDRTPGDDRHAIHDLMGNALEWTLDLYRDDFPNKNEDWVQEGGLTFRAVRGLSVSDPPPRPMPKHGASYRQPLCGTGNCPADTAKALAWVGFRCARRTPALAAPTAPPAPADPSP